MQTILRRAGHQVHTAHSGDEGIRVLQQLSSLDIVVFNNELSDKSGLDVLRYLASQPRFAITGAVLYTSLSVLELPTEHESWSRVDVCLDSPVNPNELYGAVFEAYTRRRGYLYRLSD